MSSRDSKISYYIKKIQGSGLYMISSRNNKISYYIKKIQDSVKEINDSHMKNFDNELIIAYRGESRDFGTTKLMPSLFRNSDFVNKERHLFDLMSDFGIVSSDSKNIEKLIHAQHYIAVSRVLDISFNSLIALYFACRNDNNHDANLFVFGFPKHYSPSSSYILDYYNNALSGDYVPYSRNFKVISHNLFNERIKAQSGGFVFFPGKEFYPLGKCYYREIKIKACDKKMILDELNHLFDINDYKIFPEINNVSEEIKRKFSSYCYTATNVDYVDELKLYFERLVYEITVSNYSSSELLRLLRKEKNDILMYIKKYASVNKKDEINSSQSETDADGAKLIEENEEKIHTELLKLIDDKFKDVILKFGGNDND